MNKSQRSNLTALALAGAIGLAGLAPAFAAGDSDHGERMGHRGERIFKMLDANGDGQITKAEITAKQKAEFEAADTNKDGVLSKQEMIAAATAKMAKRIEARVDRMMSKKDSDKDGSLSLTEMEAGSHMERMFDRLDTNHDGVVTKAEAEAMKDRMRERHKERMKDHGDN